LKKNENTVASGAVTNAAMYSVSYFTKKDTIKVIV